VSNKRPSEGECTEESRQRLNKDTRGVIMGEWIMRLYRKTTHLGENVSDGDSDHAILCFL
jgi:hypothetical protein